MKTEEKAFHPIQLLRTVYLDRKKKNQRYSLSAFARDLDLSVSFLSRLMRGERSLTVNQVIQIGTLLGLSADEVDQAIASLVQNAPENSKISKKFIKAIQKKETTDALKTSQSLTYYEVERFKAISAWYHLAILNLTLTKDFNRKPSIIAKRLGISSVEAQDAIHRLLNLGLLEEVNGKLKKTKQALFIKTTSSDRAIREFTEQTMDRARLVLQDSSQEAFEKRCMPGTTLPISLKSLPKLKERILKFQLELIDLSKADSYDEVYQLNLNFFPLSQPIQQNLEKNNENKK